MSFEDRFSSIPDRSTGQRVQGIVITKGGAISNPSSDGRQSMIGS